MSSGMYGFISSLRRVHSAIPGAYNKEVHLDLEDLAIDSHASPSMIRVHIKQSKIRGVQHGWKSCTPSQKSIGNQKSNSSARNQKTDTILG